MIGAETNDLETERLSVTVCETEKREINSANSIRCRMRVSHSWCASGLIGGHCDGFVTEDCANWRKTNKLQEIGILLTDSWQRDLVDFMSVSKAAI